MNEQELIPKTVESEMTDEQIIALSKKVSVLMTKPENTDTDAPLLLFLKNKGLNARAYRFTLDEERLASLYPDMKNWSEIIQKATRDHLLDKEVEVFLVTADDSEKDKDVREELLNFRGRSRNAHENEAGTLRKDLNYWSVFYPNPSEGADEYSINGFHCSTTPEEVVSNLKTFDLLDEAKKLAGME